MLRLRGGGDLARIVVTCDVLTATPCRADLVFDIDRYPQLQHVLDRVHARGWSETETGPQISDWRWACPLHARSFESYMAAYSRTRVQSGFERAVERHYIDEMRARAFLHSDPLTPTLPRQPDPSLSTITPPPDHTAIESSYSGMSSTPSFAQGFVRGHDWAHPILAHPVYRSTP